MTITEYISVVQGLIKDGEITGNEELEFATIDYVAPDGGLNVIEYDPEEEESHPLN